MTPKPESETDPWKAIQRYEFVQTNFAYTSDHEMQRSDDGEWVRFDDVFPPAALSPVEPTVHNDLCSWCLTQADHVAASEECYERNSERGRITTRPPVEPTPEPEPRMAFCDACVTAAHCNHHWRCLAECTPSDLKVKTNPCVWRITTGPLGTWVKPSCVEGSIPAPWGTERAKSCHLCGSPLRLVPSEETK
jgi:hypothetical protein